MMWMYLLVATAPKGWTRTQTFAETWLLQGEAKCLVVQQHSEHSRHLRKMLAVGRAWENWVFGEGGQIQLLWHGLWRCLNLHSGMLHHPALNSWDQVWKKSLYLKRRELNSFSILALGQHIGNTTGVSNVRYVRYVGWWRSSTTMYHWSLLYQYIIIY